MFPGLNDFFSNLSYNVGIHNPLGLLIVYAAGVVTDIGIPLILSMEIFLIFAGAYAGPANVHIGLIIVMLVLGRETGAAILFWLSYLGGDKFINGWSAMCPGWSGD